MDAGTPKWTRACEKCKDPRKEEPLIPVGVSGVVCTQFVASRRTVGPRRTAACHSWVRTLAIGRSGSARTSYGESDCGVSATPFFAHVRNSSGSTICAPAASRGRDIGSTFDVRLMAFPRGWLANIMSGKTSP